MANVAIMVAIAARVTWIVIAVARVIVDLDEAGAEGAA